MPHKTARARARKNAHTLPSTSHHASHATSTATGASALAASLAIALSASALAAAASLATALGAPTLTTAAAALRFLHRVSLRNVTAAALPKRVQPVQRSQPLAHLCRNQGGTGFGQAGWHRLSGGYVQIVPSMVPKAAQSFGQPRPISCLVCAGRYRACFRHSCPLR